MKVYPLTVTYDSMRLGILYEDRKYRIKGKRKHCLEQMAVVLCSQWSLVFTVWNN